MSRPWKCDRKLWRTAKGKIVVDGDPRAAFLVATPGMELPDKPVIEPFAGERPPAPVESSKKALEPSEDKALDPDENKAMKPSRNKKK